MYEKAVKIILTIVTISTFCLILVNIVNDIKLLSWEKTTAQITFIGLPDGAVFGNYTDYRGVHSDEFCIQTVF